MSGISVVIPTYNRATLINETLAAVFAQTLLPDEIIVVDDGSTDATRSVLAGYGSRIRPIHNTNHGELVTRNTGLRAATSRLVAFCDSDDLWLPEFLAEMSNQWQNTDGLLRVIRTSGCWKTGPYPVDQNSRMRRPDTGPACDRRPGMPASSTRRSFRILGIFSRSFLLA